MLTVPDRIQIHSKMTHKDTGTQVQCKYILIIILLANNTA